MPGDDTLLMLFVPLCLAAASFCTAQQARAIKILCTIFVIVDLSVELESFSMARFVARSEAVALIWIVTAFVDRSRRLSATDSRLRQENAAREQSERVLEELHIALTNAMPGIGRLGIDGHYLEVNEVYAGMLGYVPVELIGTGWIKTVHVDDRAQALAAYDRMVQSGKGEFEARAVRKDGSNFFKHVLMVKIVDENGRHIGHHCFMRDISERKAVEAERGRLATIVDHSDDAIVSRGIDLKILTWNAAAERRFGYLADEIVGQSIDILNPPDKQALGEQRRKLFDASVPSRPVDTG
ncbi:MAG: PAS domain S-box protein [Deltaproteobacteria bacterium]|nr:PAS domain S-box protein [Deltaproteobacteria bacterium]